MKVKTEGYAHKTSKIRNFILIGKLKKERSIEIAHL